MNKDVPPPPATTARTDAFPLRVLVVMGVSGCGKTAAGQAVAEAWGARFEDADHWHTPEAVAKMASGTPLTDEDRAPWLERLRTGIIAPVPDGSRTVLACSALKRRYRDVLRLGQTGVVFAHLTGSREVIGPRIRARRGHYMPPGLLDSQLEALEPLEPDERGFEVGVAPPLDEVVHELLRRAISA